MSDRNKRYKLRNSDRSGFTEKEITLVYDNGSLVAPDEYDVPPPSDIPLGGEGDISGDPRQNSATSYATPSGLGFTTQNITSSTAINFVKGDDRDGEPDSNFGWVYISGSNGSVVLAVNPQITPGIQGNLITVQGVGENVLLTNGSGLLLRTPKFLVDSGAIISLLYSQTDNLWHETSRSHLTKVYGEF